MRRTLSLLLSPVGPSGETDASRPCHAAGIQTKPAGGVPSSCQQRPEEVSRTVALTPAGCARCNPPPAASPRQAPGVGAERVRDQAPLIRLEVAGNPRSGGSRPAALPRNAHERAPHTHGLSLTLGRRPPVPGGPHRARARRRPRGDLGGTNQLGGGGAAVVGAARSHGVGRRQARRARPWGGGWLLPSRSGSPVFKRHCRQDAV